MRKVPWAVVPYALFLVLLCWSAWGLRMVAFPTVDPSERTDAHFVLASPLLTPTC